MIIESLTKEYDRLQKKYGAKELDAIYHGGCTMNPNICFVFMNPTGKNIASSKTWKGLKSPFIGTKNVWEFFYHLQLLDESVYHKIKSLKAKEWTESFAKEVYENVQKHRFFITNLGKCTQEDARVLPDKVYKEYVSLLKKEITQIKPKVIILFGNQVSSIVLEEKISVSRVRRKRFERKIDGVTYPFYAVYYPIGNGSFNVDKALEDVEWIKQEEVDLIKL